MRTRSWYSPTAMTRSLMLRPRVYFGALASIVALIVLPQQWPSTLRGSIAWDAGGLVYLFFAVRLMVTCGADRIKERARHRDDSRFVILTIILLAIASSFAAIAGLIGQAKSNPEMANFRFWLAVLAVFTILISWSVTQVAFAIHYAHDFYRDPLGPHGEQPLLFPGCDRPDYWDFLYFSTSIGATSQTSDTAISSRPIRRLVLLHSVVAFFFNTAVLALTVNVAASLAG
jgi:uncharacterized membrane protein